MKRVLLLNPPHRVPIMRDTYHPAAKSALYLWHPLDLLVQSGRFTDADVRIHDGVAHVGDEPLRRLLGDFRPDAVLSLIASPTLDADLALLKRIKDSTGAVVFALGDITFGEKEAFLAQHRFLDGILADFVSDGFARYVRGDVPVNAAWWDGEEVKCDWSRSQPDYARPRQDLIDLSKYYLPYWKPPFGSVYTQHGCRSKCVFCLVPRMGTPIPRDLDAVIDEVDYLYNGLGVRRIFFRDPSFNQDPDHLIPLCERLAAGYPKLDFTCWFRPSPLTPEMAGAMGRAGCRFVHLGVETGSAPFLRRLGKDFKLERVPGAIDLLHRHGIRTIGHFMVGVSGETEDDRAQTRRFLRGTKLDVVSVNVYENCHGSKMAEEDDAPTDDDLRRNLLRMMGSFYLRPGRWPGFLRFIDGVDHFFVTLSRFFRYLFGLRLFPKRSAFS